MDMTVVTYECPECGAERVGHEGWKEWCVNHAMVTVWTNEGIVKRRQVVEMKIQERAAR